MLRKLESVLIIEDNRVVRAVFCEFFKNLGVEVHETGDGKKGFDLAVDLAPQLVVMDLLIPGKTGFEVAEGLSHFDVSNRPVLFFVTAVYKSHKWEQESLKDYGAAEFLRKPVEPEELLQRLKKYFEIP